MKFLSIRSLQYFEHAIAADMLWHVQNFFSNHYIIIWMREKFIFHRIWIAIEKNVSEMDPEPPFTNMI